MNDLVVQYEKVFGCKPSEDEIQTLHQFVTAMKIKPNDALLMFFLFERRNIQLLLEIPKQISEAADKTVEAVRVRCTKELLARPTVAKPSNQRAQQIQEKFGRGISTEKRFSLVDVCIAAALMFLVGITAVSFSLQRIVLAQESARSAVEAMVMTHGIATVRTDEEQRVLQWYRRSSESVRNLMGCSLPGWQVKDGNCYPFADREQPVSGWRL